MPPGTTRTITATYTVAVGTAAPPEVTNAATVLSGIGDQNPANNRATMQYRDPRPGAVRCRRRRSGRSGNRGRPWRRAACRLRVEFRGRRHHAFGQFLRLRPALRLAACMWRAVILTVTVWPTWSRGPGQAAARTCAHSALRERGPAVVRMYAPSAWRAVSAEVARLLRVRPWVPGRGECGGCGSDGRRRGGDHYGSGPRRGSACARVQRDGRRKRRRLRASTRSTLRSRVG